MNDNTKLFVASDFLFIYGGPTHCLHHNTDSSNSLLTALVKTTQIR